MSWVLKFLKKNFLRPDQFNLLEESLIFSGTHVVCSRVVVMIQRMRGSHMMLSRIFLIAAGRQRMGGVFLLERIVVVDQTDKTVPVHSEFYRLEGEF